MGMEWADILKRKNDVCLARITEILFQFKYENSYMFTFFIIVYSSHLKFY